MAVFKNLSNECVSETENKIASRWEEMDILDRTIKTGTTQKILYFMRGRRRPMENRGSIM